MKLFFGGRLSHFLEYEKAHRIYHELHIVTLETAFVVRTFFFLIFGLTIAIASLFSLSVALISLLIIISIYGIRFVISRTFIGSNILPQLFTTSRGLITVLLFFAILAEAQVATFESGILLFVIIGTGLIMTWAMINDKRKMKTLLDQIDEEYMAMDEEEFGLGTENDKETLEKHPET